MTNRFLVILLLSILALLIDLYVFQAIKTAFQNSTEITRKIVFTIYWSITVLALLAVLVLLFTNPQKLGGITRNFILTALFANLLSKVFVVIFLLIDDIARLGKYASQKISGDKVVEPSSGNSISRSEFLAKTGLIVGSIPLFSITYGIVSGAHDYRIKRSTVTLKNLPAAFDGLKIVQISDIHSGSFFNKTAVKGGIEKIIKEKPDLIFFTGDLVNNVATEMIDYVEVFGKLSAPLGVYSTLGNHDYGDYYTWPSIEAKRKNLKTLMNIHKSMGWDLLINEHRFLKRNGEEIAIIGVENWGAGERWPKYGILEKAYKGTDNAAVKLLLSHDPSHWDAQVRPLYKDIDIMFAGHTHGFQFGIEAGDFKWSPVQYVYKQWAGLYQEENQYLYVNRGFGYIGFPGRVGMPPEITVMELKKA